MAELGRASKAPTKTERREGQEGHGQARGWTVRDVVTLVAFNLIIIAVTFVLKLGEDLLFSPQVEFFIGSWLFAEPDRKSVV